MRHPKTHATCAVRLESPTEALSVFADHLRRLTSVVLSVTELQDRLEVEVVWPLPRMFWPVEAHAAGEQAFSDGDFVRVISVDTVVSKAFAGGIVA